MLTRIVRMTFKKEEIATFLSLFNNVKTKIRHFEGCQHLELMTDIDNPNVLVTYSIWNNSNALEKYRQSELFKNTWAETKKLFDAKPIAYSLSALENVQ